MKKTIATLLISAVATVAAPAYAQASGNVVVNGSVAPKCAAIQPINGTISLGELAREDGTVNKSFAGSDVKTMFTVRCNGSNPQLSVEARPLVNSAASEAVEGYTNRVHYTARLEAMKAKGGSTSIADLSLNNGPTTGRVGDRLAAVANNVTLTIADGITENSTAILEAGQYTGTVNIIISAPL